MQNKDAIIEELRRQVALLLERVRQLEQENRMLKEKIARLERNSSNSSKPPSSDIVKPIKLVKVSGEKLNRGGQPGHSKFIRKPFKPEQVDKVIEYELKKKDAVGLVPLEQWFVIQQVELPDKMYYVTEHRARKYLDPVTGRIHIAPMPPEIRKGGLLGGRFSTMIAFMKAGCHASYGTIKKFCKEVYCLDISRGMLNKTIQKVSASLKTPYEQLYARLAYCDYVGVDETGHKNQGRLYWSWCFQDADFSVFHISPSRGSSVLKKVLGQTFKGTLGCDYYSAYRKYMKDCDVSVQFCMAHLIREIRFLAEHTDKNLSDWGNKLLDYMKKLFATLHNSSRYAANELMRSLEKIKRGFLRLVRRPPDHKLARRLAKRFCGKGANSYFRFLTDPRVEPTNNSTERAIRHVVIDRHVTQGTCSEAGMRWCERAWTIIATCKKQGRNVFDFIHKALFAHWTDQQCPALIS
jgi:transposase